MVRPVFSFQFSVLSFQLLAALSFSAILFAQDQSDYYRTVTLETPRGVNMEASGQRCGYV